jgi:hypothetical protein
MTPGYVILLTDRRRSGAPVMMVSTRQKKVGSATENPDHATVFPSVEMAMLWWATRPDGSSLIRHFLPTFTTLERGSPLVTPGGG